MNYNSHGYMQIRAFTATEAIPIPNAVIRIYSNEEFGGGIDYSVKTERSGLSEIIELPAPEVTYSLSPKAAEQAFSTYNVEISAEGYYPKLLSDVGIFSGILSILPVEMVPSSGMTRYVTPPLSTNFSIIKENEELQ